MTMHVDMIGKSEGLAVANRHLGFVSSLVITHSFDNPMCLDTSCSVEYLLDHGGGR